MLKFLKTSLASAAFFASFAAAPASAHPFDCMANSYEADHTILSWEEYQNCMKENFPSQEPEQESHEEQAGCGLTAFSD